MPKQKGNAASLKPFEDVVSNLCTRKDLPIPERDRTPGCILTTSP